MAKYIALYLDKNLMSNTMSQVQAFESVSVSERGQLLGPLNDVHTIDLNVFHVTISIFFLKSVNPHTENHPFFFEIECCCLL